MAGEVLKLDPVEVRGQRPVFPDQPQQVTVLGHEAISRAGASDLGGLLARSGFAVRAYGPTGSLATLGLRGALGEGVLVLKDGIKLNSPERGGVDLSTVSLVGVEKVEILGGGASSLYGSEAVGGVINLITSSAGANRLEAGLGTWGERYLQLELGGSEETSGWNASLQRHSAQNDFPYFYRDGVSTRTNAQFDGTELALGGRQSWGYDTLRAALNYGQQNRGVPGPMSDPSGSASQVDAALNGTLHHVHQWDPSLKQATSLSYRRTQLTYRDPPRAQVMDSDSLLQDVDLQTQLEWSADTNLLQGGLGWTHDALESNKLGAPTRDILALFAHEAWYPLERLALYGDARLDSHPTFGLNLSPRLGGSLLLVPGWRLRASVGQAYRAPSFNDLYWPADAFSQGNPALQPETTLTGEVGLDGQPGAGITAGLTGFAHRGRQTIQWQPDATGRWSPVNVGDTQVTGLETKASWQPCEILQLEAGFTWQAAINLATSGEEAGKRLIYRPDQVGQAAITWRPLKGLSVRMEWNRVGTRPINPQNTESLPACDLYATRLAYAWSPSDEAYLRVDNLLNTYYVNQPDYPMPGRTLMAGWSRVF